MGRYVMPTLNLEASLSFVIFIFALAIAHYIINYRRCIRNSLQDRVKLWEIAATSVLTGLFMALFVREDGLHEMIYEVRFIIAFCISTVFSAGISAAAVDMSYSTAFNKTQ